jgi:hypothetical protein
MHHGWTAQLFDGEGSPPFCASSAESFTSIAKTGWKPTIINKPATAQMATPPIRAADVRHRTLMTPSIYKIGIDGAALYGTPLPLCNQLEKRAQLA